MLHIARIICIHIKESTTRNECLYRTIHVKEFNTVSTQVNKHYGVHVQCTTEPGLPTKQALYNKNYCCLYYMPITFSTISADVPAIRIRCNGTWKLNAPKPVLLPPPGPAVEGCICAQAKDSTASSNKIFMVTSERSPWTNSVLIARQAAILANCYSKVRRFPYIQGHPHFLGI